MSRKIEAVFSITTALVWLFVSADFRTRAADRVDLKTHESALDITINDKPFGTYNYSSELPKPFLLPVITADGVVLNRALNDPSDADHPHHKGMWNSIDEVNEVKFWAEKGKIHNVSVRVLSAGGDAGVFEAVNEWRHPETGVTQLTETATITVHANRLLVYDMKLTATSEDVTFEDTKEGLFGFRVAPSMKEKNGGRVIASDGSRTTKDCWGRTFDWIDYSGEVDGKTAGVTIMDHPKNFRPSRYHVRDYGLFSVSPFGEKSYTNGVQPASPLHLKKGDTLRLRYAMYFHDGDTEAANVPAVWTQFLKVTEE